MREEQRLRVFENRVLRKILGPKRDKATGEWRRLQNEKQLSQYQGCGVGTQKLRLRLLHKSSICINNGKPIRHFIATT
jgi:hypothetical protein